MTLDPKALENAAVAVVSNLVPDPMLDDVERIARAAITAYLAATATPAPDPAPVSGWRLVPVEPTRAMLEGMGQAFYAHSKREGVGISEWKDIHEFRRMQYRVIQDHAYRAMLAAAPEPPVSDGFPTEHVTRKFICDGCPDLKTKDWTFEGENDDYDSGTRAFCGDRSISAYWRKNEEVPKWCPRLPAPPKQQEPK